MADYYSASSRGSAFGALYLTSALGGMGGSILATNLGEYQQPPDLRAVGMSLRGSLDIQQGGCAAAGEMTIGGLPGWRVTFYMVAAIR